eukprot:14786911-Alexandrium_andersonii.AAC.1
MVPTRPIEGGLSCTPHLWQTLAKCHAWLRAVSIGEVPRPNMRGTHRWQGVAHVQALDDSA